MANLIGFVLFALIVFVVDRLLKRHSRREGADLETSAASAMKTMNRIARRRATAAAIPTQNIGSEDTTPVFTVLAGGRRRTGTSIPPPSRQVASSGRYSVTPKKP